MAFNIDALNRELLLDNPTYARILSSDLHRLVTILHQAPARWRPNDIAAEMKRISAVKWLKYTRTRHYLEQEVPTLTNLLRATPSGFKTINMSPDLDNTILKHTFGWESDTRNLADLATVFTREKVSWPQWPAALTACIGDEHRAYRVPGFHTGLAINPANVNRGVDNHALLGPFGGLILDYQGGAVRAPMNQVYEYSYDRATWLPIPNSTFTIVREVTRLADGRIQISITKINPANRIDSCVVRKTLNL